MADKINSIKNWAIDDRPVEKLMQKGAKELSNSELLAIILNSGTRSQSALEVAREMLVLYDNDLSKLQHLSLAQIKKVKGIGNVKGCRIIAALELGNRRLQGLQETNKVVVRSSKDIFNYLRGQIIDLHTEIFGVLYLNSKNAVVSNKKISEGGINSCIVDVRMVLKYAFENNATALVIYHNHPSGNNQPSNEDIKLTNTVMEACKSCNIKLLDHLIVTVKDYFSFTDNNLI